MMFSPLESTSPENDDEDIFNLESSVEENSFKNAFQTLTDYVSSNQTDKRQLALRSLPEALSTDAANEEERQKAFQTILHFAEDPEVLIRRHLTRQLSDIVILLQDEANHMDALFIYITPVVFKLSSDSDGEVRRASHSILLNLVKLHLLTKDEMDQLVGLVVDFLIQEQTDEFKIDAISLLTSLAVLVDVATSQSHFVSTFLGLCSEPAFSVRKACAINFGKMCENISLQNLETSLLPKFASLCEDSVWGVRKACAESFVSVSTCCPPNVRQNLLTRLLLGLLRDISRWVRGPAYQALGPFIATFMDTDHTVKATMGTEVLSLGKNTDEFSANATVNRNEKLVPEEETDEGTNAVMTDANNISISSLQDCQTVEVSNSFKVTEDTQSVDVASSPVKLTAIGDSTPVYNYMTKVEVETADFEVEKIPDILSAKNVDSLSIKLDENVATEAECLPAVTSPNMAEVGSIDKTVTSASMETDLLTLSDALVGEDDKKFGSENKNEMSLQNLANSTFDMTPVNVVIIDKSEDTLDTISSKGDESAFSVMTISKDIVNVSDTVYDRELLTSDTDVKYTDLKLELENLRCQRQNEEDVPVVISTNNIPTEIININCSASDHIGESKSSSKGIVIDTCETSEPLQISDDSAEDDSDDPLMEQASKRTAFKTRSQIHFHTASMSLVSEPGEEYVRNIGSMNIQVTDELNVVDGQVQQAESLVKINITHQAIVTLSKDSQDTEISEIPKTDDYVQGANVVHIPSETTPSTGRRPLLKRSLATTHYGFPLSPLQSPSITNTQETSSSSTTELSPLEITNKKLAEDQSVVPSELLEQYLNMADPSRAQMVDAEILKHCAFNLPAVTQTLGQKNWACLRQLYQILASNMQWQVRRTVALSIHEMAMILGNDLIITELLPVFDELIKDLDEVRAGVIKHMSEFLQLLPLDLRLGYLSKLEGFLITEANTKWRYRQDFVQQLISLVRLYPPNNILQHILPMAFVLSSDKVSEVRHSAAHLLSAIVRISAEKERNLLDIVLEEIKKQLLQSGIWRQRQLYIFLSQCILDEQSVTSGDFSELFLPGLLDLINDSVPNIRITLARFLSHAIVTKPDFMTSDNFHQTNITDALHTLQKDIDSDVRYFVSPLISRLLSIV